MSLRTDINCPTLTQNPPNSSNRQRSRRACSVLYVLGAVTRNQSACSAQPSSWKHVRVIRNRGGGSSFAITTGGRSVECSSGVGIRFGSSMQCHALLGFIRRTRQPARDGGEFWERCFF